MNSRSIYTDSQWYWVAERFREGYTMSDLARFLGIHRNTVRAGLIRLGERPICRERLTPLYRRRGEFLRASFFETPEGTVADVGLREVRESAACGGTGEAVAGGGNRNNGNGKNDKNDRNKGNDGNSRNDGNAGTETPVHSTGRKRSSRTRRRTARSQGKGIE